MAATAKHLRDNMWSITDGGGEVIFCAPASVTTAPAVLALYVADTDAGQVTVRDYTDAIQQHLDRKAWERGYDTIQSAITYRDDPNPKFAGEAEALFAWRSAVWTYCYAELAKVEGGQREQPGIDDFVGELPAFDWPEI